MSADLDFFAPANAPRELLHAAQVAYPGRQIEWLCRHRIDSAVGGYLANQVRELVVSSETVGRLNLQGTHVLFVGLGDARTALHQAAAAGGENGKRRAARVA